MTRINSQEERKQKQDAKQRASDVVINMALPPVVYARQSTKDQPIKDKYGKAMQTDELLNLAEIRGWNRDTVWLFVENYYDQYGKYNPQGKARNASGKLQIDKRPGLQHVVHLIETDQVSAVIVREISRLFRDETLIVATMFADVCKRHHVVIIAPRHIYDFNADERGDFARFISDAQTAAAYLKFMREVVSGARLYKGSIGEYCGHAVPTGFMMNEDRSGYEANPLWCNVVASLTHRYRQLDGDLSTLRREIFGKCLFPDLPDEIAARVGKVYLEKVTGGYTIKSRSGLVSILTNVSNIGHMAFDGEIVKLNAHERIVDLDDFMFALYHLSERDLNGETISRQKRAIRLPQKGTIAPYDGLLSGVREDGRPTLSSDQGYVYLFQRTGENDATYAIKNGKDMTLGQYTGSIVASTLDKVFEAQLLKRLDELSSLVQQKKIQASQGKTVYESQELANVASGLDSFIADQQDKAEMVIDHFTKVRQDVTRSIAGVSASIAELKRRIGVLKYDLERDRIAPFMDDIDREDCYVALKNLRADLASLERKQEDAGKTMQAIESTSQKILTARGYWNDFTLEQKQSFVRLVTQDIMLHDTGIGFMELTVTWISLISPEVEKAYIMATNGSGMKWNAQELDVLREYYPQGTKTEMIHMLPRRSWRSCITKASQEGIERFTRRIEDTGIGVHYSLEAHRYMIANGLQECDDKIWWSIVRTYKQYEESKRGDKVVKQQK